MNVLIEKSFKKEKNLIISEIDKEAIIFESSTGIYFKTNNVGSFILNLLVKKKSFSDVLEITSKNFDVPEEKISEDIINFLTEAIKKKLIEISN